MRPVWRTPSARRSIAGVLLAFAIFVGELRRLVPSLGLVILAFFVIGVPVTLVSMVLVTAYLLVRYI